MIFYPSCKAKLTYPKEHKKLVEYLNGEFDIKIAGCCRVDHKLLLEEDTALVICNNCSAIIEENSQVSKVKFIWELIDEDKEFQFPNYYGEKMTIKDCWISSQKIEVQKVIRSLLKKMNIDYLELENNYDKADSCGINLLSIINPGNKKLASNTYNDESLKNFKVLTSEEQELYLKKYYDKVETEKVVCYCKFCAEGAKIGTKIGIHMLELLFKDKE